MGPRWKTATRCRTESDECRGGAPSRWGKGLLCVLPYRNHDTPGDYTMTQALGTPNPWSTDILESSKKKNTPNKQTEGGRVNTTVYYMLVPLTKSTDERPPSSRARWDLESQKHHDQAVKIKLVWRGKGFPSLRCRFMKRPQCQSGAARLATSGNSQRGKKRKPKIVKKNGGKFVNLS